MSELLRDERTRRRLSFLINLCFWAVWIVGLVLAGRMLVRVLLPFVCAFIAAAVVQKPIAALQKRFSFTHSFAASAVSILCLLTVATAAVLLCYYGGAFLLRLLQQEQTHAAIQTLGESIKNTFSSAVKSLTALLPSDAAETVLDAIRTLENALLENGAALLADLSGKLLLFATNSLPRFLLSALFFVLAFVFFARDYKAVCDFFKRQIPTARRPFVRAAVCALKETTLSALKAYFILGLITFGEMAVGFWLLRLPVPLLLAFITALVDALPVLGVGTILLPIAIFRLLSGNMLGGVGVLVLYAVSTLSRHFLQPRLISRETGLPPLITLLTMYVGWRLVGLVGLLGAPILAMVILRLQKEGHLHIFR